MVPRLALPPTKHHPELTVTLDPTLALQQLSNFLSQSQRKPYLHPDSFLSRTGVTFSAHSGPSGGLALHHLKRIEAGLRGESLVEDLSRFGEQVVGEEEDLPEGDDSRLDALLKLNGEVAEGQVLGRKGGLKRKRRQDIEDWAESSSQAGPPSDDYFQEIESFANTPLHVSDWQEQADYELQQSPLEGDMGESDGAPMTYQNGEIPEVVEHDDDGRIKEKRKGGGKTDAEKQAKRDEKRAMKKARRRALASEAQGKG